MLGLFQLVLGILVGFVWPVWGMGGIWNASEGQALFKSTRVGQCGALLALQLSSISAPANSTRHCIGIELGHDMRKHASAASTSPSTVGTHGQGSCNS